MCLNSVLNMPLRVRAGVIAFCCVSIAISSYAQSPAPATVPAPTCADLHLVPAPRECTAVATIPIDDLGFFVTAVNNTEAVSYTHLDVYKRQG